LVFVDNFDSQTQQPQQSVLEIAKVVSMAEQDWPGALP
jgi:hypothetical protein